MVAHVLRLRLDLLVGALRHGARHRARAWASLLLTVVLVAAACIGIRRLDSAPTAIVLAVSVVAGAAIVLGFFLAPLFSVEDDSLDPRRFVIFGQPPRRTLPAVLVASLVSVPLAGLVVIGFFLAAVWIDHGVPAGRAVVSVGLAVATCALAGKLAQATASLLLHRHRSRELTSLFVTAVFIVIVPVMIFVASLNWAGRVPDEAAHTLDVLALTPVGAAWSLASPAGSALSWLVALVTVLALAGAWTLLARRLMTRVDRPTAARERARLGWFALTGGTPTGAIAARSLVYWLRDPRYLVNLIVTPLVVCLVVVPLVVVGVPLQTAVLLPPPLMALFFGWLVHNDVAYDSSALWMHVAAGVRGRQDRAGRLAPVLLVSLPVLAVAVTVAVRLHGHWSVLPAMTGVCLGLLLSGLGLSSLASAIAPYPASRPGDSPFVQPQRTNGGLAQGTVLLGTLVVSAPTVWWGARAVFWHTHREAETFWLGLGTGLVVLVLGILLGGWVFQRRSGRLMEFASAS